MSRLEPNCRASNLFVGQKAIGGQSPEPGYEVAIFHDLAYFVITPLSSLETYAACPEACRICWAFVQSAPLLVILTSTKIYKLLL